MPTKKGSQRKTERLEARVTPETKALIEKRASALGLSLSAYLTMLVHRDTQVSTPHPSTRKF